MQKVLFDANSAVLRGGKKYLPGIGRTSLELLQALSQEQLPITIQLYIQNLKGDASALKQLPFSKLNIPLPGAKKYKELVTKVNIKEVLSNYDLLHIPHNYDMVVNPEKTVVTIHDAMFFSYPEDFLGHEYARKHYPTLAKSCRAIVTCSESSKSDIVNYMNISSDKITVIPWGVSHGIFYPESKENIRLNLNQFNIERPYFIMVSCDIGRKNTISLLRAYKLFIQKKREHDLVLIWNNTPSEILNEFSTEINNGRIHFLSGVNDFQLRSLYSAATASFFPSKYEGFGLPILESMACGTPVVTCNNSSLSEVGADVALYTNPDNTEQMAEFMSQFEINSLDLIELNEKSIIHAAKFNWSNVADDYILFYQKYL